MYRRQFLLQLTEICTSRSAQDGCQLLAMAASCPSAGKFKPCSTDCGTAYECCKQSRFRVGSKIVGCPVTDTLWARVGSGGQNGSW